MKLVTNFSNSQYYMLANAKPILTAMCISGSYSVQIPVEKQVYWCAVCIASLQASAANIPSRVTSIHHRAEFHSPPPPSLSLSVHTNSLKNQYALLPWRLASLPARASATFRVWSPARRACRSRRTCSAWAWSSSTAAWSPQSPPPRRGPRRRRTCRHRRS